MPPNPISRVATAFRLCGAAIGIPSLVVLAVWAAWHLHGLLAAPTVAPQFGDHPDALLLMLQGMTVALGAIARIAGSLAQVLLDALALAAACGLVLGIALEVTARGLRAGAGWARWGAAALLLPPTLLLPLLGLSLHGTGRALMGAAVVLCLLGWHALWSWRAGEVR